MWVPLPPAEPRRVKAKICLVGDPEVGKTSLIRRFVLDQYDDRYLSTLGTKVTKKEVSWQDPESGRGVVVSLMVWDIMGQAPFRELLRETYFNEAKGIVAVADLSRPSTLGALPEWVDAVNRTAGNVPLVIALNKADLVDRNLTDTEQVREIAKSLHADTLPTSAKTGENVEEVFRRLALRIAAPAVPEPDPAPAHGRKAQFRL